MARHIVKLLDKEAIMKNNHTYGGYNFMGLLTLLFIYLRLAGHVAWPWAWVLSPIWLPATVLIVVTIIVSVVGAIRGNN